VHIFVNFESNHYDEDNKRKFEFEVAFSFMLGPTTTPQQMRGAFFRALGVWNKNVENIVKIMLHG
jgi:hypothetical protein